MSKKKRIIDYKKVIEMPRFGAAMIFVLAFIGTVQAGFLMGLSADYGAAWGFVLTAIYAADTVLLFFFCKFVRKTKDEKHKKRSVFSCIAGILFALTLVAGYELQYRGYTDPGMSGKLMMLVRSAAFLPILYPLFYLAFYYCENIKLIKPAKKGDINVGKIFFIAWAVIFVAYIPAFLAYYPMILSYDFHAQVLMAEGGFPDYWMHHPYLSTMMIAAFYKIGKAMGNVQAGMALMGITHMLLSSAAYAYLVTVVSRLIPRKWVSVATTLILALCPTNPVMVLCTTKDVVFSDLFVVFVALGIVRFVFCDDESKGKKIGLDIAIVLTGAMACLWRNNFVYAVIAAGLLLVIFVKKRYKLVILAMTVLIYLGNAGGIALLRDVIIHDQHGTNSIEMLSVVVQAFGRTVTYNRDSLPDDVAETINKYVPKEYWGNYNPAISDPLKNMLAYTYYDSIDGKMGTLLSDWISVGLKYPDQYIDSFLDTTRGFWFIDDTSYANVLGEGLEGNMGIIYTYYSSESWAVEEIRHDAKLPGVYSFYEKMISRNDVLRWPVLNLLFKPAFYTLLTLFAALLFLYKKEWTKLGFTAFPVMYIGTMFFGPVVQYRYVYPWILTSFLMAALVFVGEKEKNEEKIVEEH
ncbi:MAG: DUF6020 family protein [Lachnospiraceae bacterium]|nr:DUF6020 family protein [Lachnospiraceae bacterium]